MGFHKERRSAGQPDEATAAAISWIRANPIKVAALDEKDHRSELIRQALDALSLTTDGKPAAATVVARKRSVFYGVLNYAVELDILPANPVNKVRWKAPATADEVDRRVVASPAPSQPSPGRRRQRTVPNWSPSSPASTTHSSGPPRPPPSP